MATNVLFKEEARLSRSNWTHPGAAHLAEAKESNTTKRKLFYQLLNGALKQDA